MRVLRRFARCWWATIPEPRLVSAGVAIAYALAVVGGARILLAPPAHTPPDVQALVVTIAWLLILGGLLAAGAGWADAWALERPGLALLIMATIAHTIVLAVAEHRGESRSADLVMTSFGLLLFAIRLGMIWRYSRRPRG
ncbi:MAG: hypothetical protein D3X82_16945 [Candidatus Leucobacter sulfamidivorax]|nr:hypothetical protein [Candidatus Leucobacter sulfamidivorax]